MLTYHSNDPSRPQPVVQSEIRNAKWVRDRSWVCDGQFAAWRTSAPMVILTDVTTAEPGTEAEAG